MKLYLNDTAHEVPLHTKLTPALYDKVTPLLSELARPWFELVHSKEA